MRQADEPLSRTARLWLAFYVTWVALGIALVSTCSSCAARQMPDEVPTLVEPAVAQLTQTVDGKHHGDCTVFKVGANLAMTAGHCCGYFDPLEALAEELGATPVKHTITYHATGPYAVPGAAFEVLVDDDDHDVCVLRGQMQGAPLAIAPHDPPRGARVWTAGYPQDTYLVSDGHWSGRDKHGRAIASVAVWRGASGSPILDSHSRVVGVLRAFKPDQSNLAIITALEWVRSAYATGRGK